MLKYLQYLSETSPQPEEVGTVVHSPHFTEGETKRGAGSGVGSHRGTTRI